MCSQVLYQISDMMGRFLTQNGLRGFVPPASEGLITLVVVFPAVKVEQEYFSLEADVKKGDLSL